MGDVTVDVIEFRGMTMLLSLSPPIPSRNVLARRLKFIGRPRLPPQMVFENNPVDGPKRLSDALKKISQL